MTTDKMTDNAIGNRLTGSFTLDSWEQKVVDDRDGSPIARAHLTKTFTGDLTGTSSADILLAGGEGGARAYCGFERITGTVAGRTGSVVLRHNAQGDADSAWMTWQVLPGSGSGELAGVTGEGQITRHDDGSHSYWLELAFG